MFQDGPVTHDSTENARSASKMSKVLFSSVEIKVVHGRLE